MKILHRRVLLVLLSFFFLTAYAQERAIASGDHYFKEFAYKKAIKEYLKAINQGANNPEVYANLADSYYYKMNMPSAEIWYSKLMETNSEILTAPYFLRYSQVLRSMGDYAGSDKLLKRINNLNVSGATNGTLSRSEHLSKLLKMKRFRIDSVSINSSASEFVTAITSSDEAFLASSRAGRIDRWTDQPFLDLYKAAISPDFDLTDATLSVNKIGNKLYNESTLVFTKDGHTVYFTGNSQSQKKGTTHLLKIYKATKTKKGDWGNIEALPFTSDDYSTAHPTLSADEKTMYFASNMPGTLGMSDIYEVSINNDGSFGTPRNLGASINTIGRETFPFITPDGRLYFASDGHWGLGGLDLFVCLDLDTPTAEGVKNLGAPINSRSDDFAFILKTGTNHGYFASNRPGGAGDDDIYRFERLKDVGCYETLKGQVVDAKTLEPLDNVKVTLNDRGHKILKTIMSNSNGRFEFVVSNCEDTSFYVLGEKMAYDSEGKEVKSISALDKSGLTLSLKPKQKISKDLNHLLSLKPIYYDYDKWTIRRDSKQELDKVVAYLKQYSKIKIDIRSYTDSRGSDTYNMRLSERRNQSIKDYLSASGVPSNRFTGKGYGETGIVNRCSNGVPCSAEEHEANRRSEFIITEN